MKSFVISHDLPELFVSAKVTSRGSTVLVHLVDSEKSAIPYFQEQRMPYFILPQFEKLIKPTPFQKDKLHKSFSPLRVKDTKDDDSIRLIVKSKTESVASLKSLNRSLSPIRLQRETSASWNPYKTRQASIFFDETKRI